MTHIINPEKHLSEVLNYFKNGKGRQLFNVGNEMFNNPVVSCSLL